jgi:hypothetical protein
MCRMAGKHADGLLFNGSHPDDLAWARDRIDEGAADRPDDRGAVDLAAYASVSVAEEASAARELAVQPVAFIAAGAAPPVLDRHGLDADRAERIGEQLSAGDFSAAFDAVTPAMVDAFCIAGTPETVAERMAAVLEHADSLVVGSPLGPELETAVELAGAAAREAGVGIRAETSGREGCPGGAVRAWTACGRTVVSYAPRDPAATDRRGRARRVAPRPRPARGSQAPPTRHRRTPRPAGRARA